MKRVFVSVFFVLVAMIVNAQDIAGHWGGTLNIQGVKLRLVFHVSRSGDSWTTTMDSPDQGAKGIPTGKTEYADSVLTITAPALGNCRRPNLDPVTVADIIIYGYQPSVYLGSDHLIAHGRMDPIGKINRCGAFRKTLNITAWRKTEYTVRKQIQITL